MDKIKEIVEAWLISFNPTEEQKLLAEKRYEICISCEYKKKNIIGEFCGKCGCPLSKKIFTTVTSDSCPLKKWSSVEKEFYEKKKSKYKLI